MVTTLRSLASVTHALPSRPIVSRSIRTLAASSSSAFTTSNSNTSSTTPLHQPASTLQRRSLSTSPPQRAAGSGLVKATLALTLVGITSYVVGSLYPPEVLKILYKPPTPPRLKSDGPEAEANARAVEDAMHALPLVQQLKSQSVAHGSAAELEVLRANGKNITDLDPNTSVAVPAASRGNVATSGPPVEGGPADTHLYVMTRPYLKYSREKAQHNLTAGSLRGPGMIAIPPLVFAKTALGAQKLGGAEGDGTIVLHLGRSVCGHDGIVHGGMLATVVDEALARTAMYNLPGKIGVTARLEIDYRKPTMANQYVVISTSLVEAKGRKATVKGAIHDTNGQLLLECRAIFVEPKYARYFLDPKAIKQAIEG
ncbi:Thioesterase/thiol ester dehydrase-isomerase [Testicularia cyperi]|uniref:Thioesterase/thiol ester dehydrase-isomerase n=1 Tax=Testicularia cyperi TaxID=1882483 RepID=A0A317XJU3_9BASI|nr:Thioesterase/thiol ester dehydrase-isomerase [Testicularia cyperi]